MHLAESIIKLYEQVKKTHKGVEYEIVKDNKEFHAEIEREEIEGTTAKSQETTDRKAKAYINSVV